MHSRRTAGRRSRPVLPPSLELPHASDGMRYTPQAIAKTRLKLDLPPDKGNALFLHQWLASRWRQLAPTASDLNLPPPLSPPFRGRRRRGDRQPSGTHRSFSFPPIQSIDPLATAAHGHPRVSALQAARIVQRRWKWRLDELRAENPSSSSGSATSKGGAAGGGSSAAKAKSGGTPEHGHRRHRGKRRRGR